MILRESKMFQPIRTWLLSLGYEVWAEVPYPYGCGVCDIVAKKDDYIIAIEMKTSLTWTVIEQALLSQLFADESYAAVATRPRSHSKMRDGIGLLIVNGGIGIIISPSKNERFLIPNYKSKMLERLSHMEPAGEEDRAGIPQLAGEGPAQDCYKRVEQFRADNPGVKWKDIFRAVPNHYSSYRSMQGALKKSSPEAVEIRKFQRKQIKEYLAGV
jgi:hypothetical protein